MITYAFVKFFSGFTQLVLVGVCFFCGFTTLSLRFTITVSQSLNYQIFSLIVFFRWIWSCRYDAFRCCKNKSYACTGIRNYILKFLVYALSKVIHSCDSVSKGLLQVMFCDWSRNSRHPLNQSDLKLKPIASWLLTFSCALDSLLVYEFSLAP